MRRMSGGLGLGGRDATSDPVSRPAINIAAVRNLDVRAVKADLRKLLTDSKEFWPADVFGGEANYGGLFIRLSWHNAGSYRTWDGRGGADGGRQRFYPEESWPDNTNLDKARKLLDPIKAKYGDALSYGDLYVLAGTVAIEAMGGPSVGFCAGRIDDADGAASLPLGPTPEQRAIAPCTPGDGDCEQGEALGQTTMGLIYVNPEGVLGEPVPEKSVPQIRETFGRMGMNDSETVALIGGGHAFGKAHGACLTGAGPGPEEQPDDPWPGTCGEGPMKGKGPNAFTSGLEGYWTTTPFSWSNQYFKSLLKYDWEKFKGAGGHWQWRPVPKPSADGGAPEEEPPAIQMFTTDVALTKDPEYLKWVKVYAQDLDALTKAFGAAWYKLITRDMGPATRCLGNEVPPPQPWQAPLPPPPAARPDYAKLAGDVRAALAAPAHGSNLLPPDSGADGRPTYAALFASLAYNCAGTYRATDYHGGCNGGRIRFEPQISWPHNAGFDQLLRFLKPIHALHPSLTWADLIVFAGTLAVADASGQELGFCPGRSDAHDGAGTEYLAPRKYPTLAVKVRDDMVVQGLTPAEGVALAGRPRSAVQMRLRGYSGTWSADPATLDNAYFKALLSEVWEPATSEAGLDEYKARGKDLWMLPEDVQLLQDPEFKALVQRYASDNNGFLDAFGAAWTKVMNADRFSGPTGNVCDEDGAALQLRPAAGAARGKPAEESSLAARLWRVVRTGVASS